MAVVRESVGAALSRLLGAGDIRRIAERLDLRPTKKRGQNFVIDGNTVRSIVAKAQLGRADHVVEIGPGLGSLTLGLLDAVDRVTAIEVDDVLAGGLAATVDEFAPEAADRLTVIHADALAVSEPPAPAPTALVANLPYNVSVPVLLHWFALAPTIERGLVMVQSEVARRLVAEPGSRTYGVPSAKAAWYADLSWAGSIGRRVFWPEPNVDSALVRWHRREPPRTAVPREQVFAVIDAAFAQRRKTLRSTLAGLAGGAQRAERAIRDAGRDPQDRGEVLDIAEFTRIAEALALPGR